MGPEPSASLDVERASARNRANSSEWGAGRYEAATRSVMVRVVVFVLPAAFLALIATVIASRSARGDGAELGDRRRPASASSYVSGAAAPAMDAQISAIDAVPATPSSATTRRAFLMRVTSTETIETRPSQGRQSQV